MNYDINNDIKEIPFIKPYEKLIFHNIYNTFKNEDGYKILDDEFLKRSFFDDIIDRQVCKNGKIYIYIDFNLAETIIKCISYFMIDDFEFKILVLISRKFFIENNQKFIASYELNGCMGSFHKTIIYKNKKVNIEIDEILRRIHQRSMD